MRRGLGVVVACLLSLGCEPELILPEVDRSEALSASLHPSMVEICHLDESEGYRLMSVPPAALPGHLSHGDGFPGEPVPGQEDTVFGSVCEFDEADPGDPGDPGEGPISGTVTDRDGVPVFEVGVVAFDPAANTSVASVHTDESGAYLIPDPGIDVRLMYLPQMDSPEPGGGEYHVYVPACYGTDTWDFVCSEGALVSPGTSDVDVALVPAIIEGLVTDRDGNPLEDIAVSVYLADDTQGNVVNTGSDGRYRMVGLTEDVFLATLPVRVEFAPQPGDFGLFHHVPQCYDGLVWEHMCPSGEEVPPGSVDVDAALVPAVIEGWVTDRDGIPLEDIAVAAYFPDDTQANFAHTGPDGRYRIEGLTSDVFFASLPVRVEFIPQPGDFGLFHHVPQCYDGLVWEHMCPSGEEVPPGSVDVDAVLVPAVIEGRVTDLDGTPLEDIAVAAYLPDGTQGNFAHTGPDGRYRIEGLTTDVFFASLPVRVEFLAHPGQDGFLHHVAQCYDGLVWDVRCPHGDELPPGSADIDAALVPATIEGTVTDTDGVPVAGVEVRVIAQWGDLYRTVFTDADGRYLVDGWASDHPEEAHEVRVAFEPPAGTGLAAQCYDGAPFDATCSAGALVAPGSSGVDAVLVPTDDD